MMLIRSCEIFIENMLDSFLTVTVSRLSLTIFADFKFYRFLFAREERSCLSHVYKGNVSSFVKCNINVFYLTISFKVPR